MRLGLLVFATKNGLSYQTHALYKHLKPYKTMLVDISRYNKQKVYDDWYNFDIRTDGIPTNRDVDKFLKDLDVVFVCETPLNYYLFERAEQLGVKTILQVNPEFCDYFNRNVHKPDLFALPSLWMTNKFNSEIFPHVMHLPVPVDTDELPVRDITYAQTFFHIAGRPAVHDRNGTLDFIAAVKIAEEYITGTYIIYAQELTPEIKRAVKGTNIQISEAEEPKDLYVEGDILVLPRKYGGLCLPANEAVASGIPILMPNIDPNNRWLPTDWLIPVAGKFTFMTRLPIDGYTVNIFALANMMINLYNNNAKVKAMAKVAREMGELMSWDKQLIRYKTVLKELVNVHQRN